MRDRGEMPERPKGHDWKSCIPLITGSRVRIPLSPPAYAEALAGKQAYLANEALTRAQVAAKAPTGKPENFASQNFTSYF
jgi:hypothetical protein